MRITHSSLPKRLALICILLSACTAAALTPAGAQEPEPAPAGATQEPATIQEPAAPQRPPQQLGRSIMDYVEALPESEAVVFSFNNREIVTLRAQLLGRGPAARASTATRRLNEAIGRGGDHELSLVPIESGFVIGIDGNSVLAITPQDLDPLSTDTVSSVAEGAMSRLRVAVDEAVELRNPTILLAGLARTAVATLVFLLLVWLLLRLRRRLEAPLIAVTSERISDTGAAGRLLSAEIRIDRWARRLLLLLLGAISLVASYVWLAYSLRQFPYTRPWGEALGDTLLSTLAWLAHGVAGAIPGLFTVAVVVVITRLVTRLVRIFFDAVRDGRIRIAGLDPDAAKPTRQIVVAVLWIFALVVSYPYLPGSGTEAFRGVSVFIGVVLSIGSTGIVNQAMSGLILMYSAALKPGEYIRVGEVEGTVMHLGLLSTRIRTLHREIVTVPNSVMITREAFNYSRLSNNGVAIKTTLTLGYDIPWRQVHAVLRMAAERTSGVRESPEPVVQQTALSDFYVNYRLIAYIDDPRARPRQLTELHGHILDLCNEHGIQILSPHFVGEPEQPAVVPRERWAAPPAEAEPETEPGS